MKASPRSDGKLIQQYDARGSPVTVFATADEQMMGRTRWYLMPPAYLERMKMINEGWPRLRLLVNSLKDDPLQGTAAAEVGDMYWQRDMPREAKPYFRQAIDAILGKGAPPTDDERRALVRSCLGLLETSLTTSGSIDANELQNYITWAKQNDAQNAFGLLDDIHAWEAFYLYYVRKDHEGTLRAARAMLGRFADSNAADVALFAMAAAQSATGKKDDAIKTLETLLEKHPRSRFLERAVGFLENLGRKMRE